MERYARMRKYRFIYDHTTRETFNGTPPYTEKKEKIIFATSAADAIAMFDFWAKGECHQWGIYILGRECIFIPEMEEENAGR